jgi:hypothetical protein
MLRAAASTVDRTRLARVRRDYSRKASACQGPGLGVARGAFRFQTQERRVAWKQPESELAREPPAPAHAAGQKPREALYWCQCCGLVATWDELCNPGRKAAIEY